MESEDDKSPDDAWMKNIRDRFPDWHTEAAHARWPDARRRLEIGQMVSGVVIAQAPFGVWVDIAVEHPALLLTPEMSGFREGRICFEDYPPIGALVQARIMAMGEKAEISLTQHPPE